MAALRISLKFRRYPDENLQIFADGVVKKMTDNSHFPDPPLTMQELSSASVEFRQAVTAALGRNSQMIGLKAAKRLVLIDLLKLLAAYVQFTARGNETVALSSGFDLASRNTTPSELETPLILKITNVASTKLGLKIKRVRNARVYEVWLRELNGDWRLAQTFPNTRNMVLTGLKPGMRYDIRVRAVGGSTGYSQWSEPLQHMST